MEDTAFLYFLLSLLLLFLGFRFYLSRTSLKQLIPPSPPGLPILGHLHLLKPPIHRTLHKLAQKHGPIISLQLGSRLVVVVSSLSLVEECFTKNDIVLANRPKTILAKHLSYDHTTIVQSPYGDHWRNLRRIGATEIFSTYRLNMFSSIRKDEIKRLLIKLSHNSLQGFAKVELRSLFQHLTFNIMVRMISGERYYGDDVSNEDKAEQFREMMLEISRYAGTSNPGDFLPILNWIDGGRFEKRVIGIAKRADKFLQSLIDEHRSNDLEDKNTVIDHLLSSQKSEPEYYTDKIIKGLIMTMLLAGTDTSSVTMEWALSNLLNHPEALKKARDELDKQVGQERLLDETDLSKLPYLRSIIFETLRLCTSVPLLVPHQSSDSCTIGGYHVPRDTMLLVNAWAIHRDPSLWDDAESFKPERFENGEEEAYNKLLPFGLGRRSCPGEGLAQRVVGLTLGSLIQCFDWERVTEKEVDMTERRGGITMPKAEALEAMCRARPIMNNLVVHN